MTVENARRRVARSGPRQNLTERVLVALRKRLAVGDLGPGDRLPTENELARAHGVSRSVVREAIAGLRADGVVTARQGSGVFVADRGHALDSVSQHVTLDAIKVSEIIEVLELRAAVESEAAGLAAQRCSPAGLIKIKECHAAVAEAVANGEQAEAQDFALHLAIAESAHNQRFVEFFRFLGARTIPRAQILKRLQGDDATRDYLERIHDEHGRIVDAIAARDPERARGAMRAHLEGSQARYERIAEVG